MNPVRHCQGRGLHARPLNTTTDIVAHLKAFRSIRARSCGEAKAGLKLIVDHMGVPCASKSEAAYRFATCRQPEEGDERGYVRGSCVGARKGVRS